MIEKEDGGIGGFICLSRALLHLSLHSVGHLPASMIDNVMLSRMRLRAALTATSMPFWVPETGGTPCPIMSDALLRGESLVPAPDPDPRGRRGWREWLAAAVDSQRRRAHAMQRRDVLVHLRKAICTSMQRTSWVRLIEIPCSGSRA